MKRGRELFLVAMLAVMTWMPQKSFACGSAYCYDTNLDELHIERVPEATFSDELLRIAGIQGSLSMTQYHDPEAPAPKPKWRESLEADLQDLQTALEESGCKTSQTLLNEYEEMRRAMKKYYHRAEKDTIFRCVSNEYVPGSVREGELYLVAPNKKIQGSMTTYPADPQSLAPTTLTLTQLETIPPGIPKEFSLYVQGAHLWYQGRRDAATDTWQSLLNLPRDQRRWKSVWAAFMIGKAQILIHPDRAIQAFEQAREMAANGFPDSLDLARDSWSWQALAERAKGDVAAALLHYFQSFKHASDENERRLALWSILRVCGTVPFRKMEENSRVFSDPVIRKILTAYVQSRPVYVTKGSFWLTQLAKQNMDIPDDELARMVLAAYYSGDVATAEAFYARMKRPTPMAQWVHAKALLRDGKIGEGQALLKLAVQENWGFRKEVRHDQALLFLAQNKFPEALDAFMEAGQMPNTDDDFPNMTYRCPSDDGVFYLADRILTMDELAAYITKREKNKANSPEIQAKLPLLRNVLFRRLMRTGQYKTAGKWCPEETREFYDYFLEHITAAQNAKNSKRDRALGYVRAGTVLCQKGTFLMATEVEPDRGRYYSLTHAPRPSWKEALPRTFLSERLAKRLVPTEEECRRGWAHAPSIAKHNHYKWVAAGLIRKASELLPDNDLLTAYALYCGGNWIRLEDPKGADWFYKRLVWRNRKIPLAQQADKEHWFPVQLTSNDIPAELSDLPDWPYDRIIRR